MFIVSWVVAWVCCIPKRKKMTLKSCECTQLTGTRQLKTDPPTLANAPSSDEATSAVSFLTRVSQLGTKWEFLLTFWRVMKSVGHIRGLRTFPCTESWISWQLKAVRSSAEINAAICKQCSLRHCMINTD
jgi:hypothetical protein